MLFLLGVANASAQSTNHNYIRVESARQAEASEAAFATLPVELRPTTVQYFDGLGRPSQTVAQQQSPTSRDAVSFHQYDAYGRETRAYLPFTKANNAGQFVATATSDQASFYQQTARVAHSPHPYADQVFEASPANRVIENGAPGTNWQLGSGHTLQHGFRPNTAADDVWHWKWDEALGQPVLALSYDPANITPIGYTGFEGNDQGNVNYDGGYVVSGGAHQGNHHFYPNGGGSTSITFNGLDAQKQYLLKFYVKKNGGEIGVNGITYPAEGNGQWAYMEVLVESATQAVLSSASGVTARFDEVRLFQVKRSAQISDCIGFQDKAPASPAAGQWSYQDNLRQTSYNGLLPYSGSHFYLFFSGGSATQAIATGLDPAKSYVVSFYGQGATSLDVAGTTVPLTGSWTYYEVVVTGQSAIAVQSNGGTGYNAIDELCLGVEQKIMHTYGTNTLIMSSSEDEHGGKTIEFADKLGNVLRKQRMAPSGELLTTDFVYDYTGLLRAVIPPLCIHELETANTNDISIITGELIYTYKYDHKLRLIESYIPNSGKTLIVYDLNDRPILSQSQNQSQIDQWVFTKYDQFDRPVLSGLFDAAAAYTMWNPGGVKPPLSREVVQSWADANSFSGVANNDPLWEAPSSIQYTTWHGYTHRVFPQEFCSVHIVNYYDDYDFNHDGSPDYSFIVDPGSALYPQAAAPYNQGRATGTKVKVLDGSGTFLTTVTFYDNKGRPIQNQSENVLGGNDQEDFRVDFSGKITHRRLLHDDGAGNTVTVHNRYTFDHGDRLTYITHRNNSAPEITFAHYVYNESGQLVEKNLHYDQSANGQYLQSIDMGYNIRGWLTNINSDNLANDAFTNGFLDQNGNGGYQGQLVQEMTLQAIEVVDEGGNERLELQITDLKLHLPAGQPYEPGGEAEQLFSTTVNLVLAERTETDPEVYDQLLWLQDPMVLAFSNQDLTSSMSVSALLTEVGNQTNDALTGRGIENVSAQTMVAGVVDDYVGGKLTSSWQNNDNNDVFGMELTYDQPVNGLTAAAQHNGNVATATWKSASDGQRKGYGYHYDDFNRLTGAHYAENTTLGWNYHINRYSVSNISYDANGNILSLKRQGYLQSGNYGTMDDLQYSYAGNQLQAVNDLAGQLGENDFRDNAMQALIEYNYDANGNMIQDQNKGITVDYNHLNLPTKVDFGGGKEIHNTYDATGTKVRSTVKEPGTPDVEKTYTKGFVYQGSTLEFFATDEGRVTPLASGGQQFQYEYHYLDHLGNLRLAFADLDGDGTLNSSTEILQEQHYYPFGLEMRYASPPPALGVQHTHTFGRKELVENLTLNWHDYGARFYDPQLGRWHAVDPLADAAFNWSPYRYGFNNPIRFIDPDGRNEDEFNLDVNSGQLVKVSDKGGDSFHIISFGTYTDNNSFLKIGEQVTIEGKQFYYGPVGRPDGTFVYGVSKADYWSDIPSEYLGHYNILDLYERYQAKKEGGMKIEMIREMESNHMHRSEMLWNTTDLYDSVVRTFNDNSSFVWSIHSGAVPLPAGGAVGNMFKYGHSSLALRRSAFFRGVRYSNLRSGLYSKANVRWAKSPINKTKSTSPPKTGSKSTATAKPPQSNYPMPELLDWQLRGWPDPTILDSQLRNYNNGIGGM
ncbi:MAG: DUF6443 domain-containing protein [Salibacteraceae bacterium]